MEITKDDFNEFKQGIKADLKEFKQDIIQTMDDKFRINNDILCQEINASEARLEKKILTGVAEILDTTVLPQLEELDTRVTKLETKTASL